MGKSRSYHLLVLSCYQWETAKAAPVPSSPLLPVCRCWEPRAASLRLVQEKLPPCRSSGREPKENLITVWNVTPLWRLSWDNVATSHSLHTIVYKIRHNMIKHKDRTKMYGDHWKTVSLGILFCKCDITQPLLLVQESLKWMTFLVSWFSSCGLNKKALIPAVGLPFSGERMGNNIGCWLMWEEELTPSLSLKCVWGPLPCTLLPRLCHRKVLLTLEAEVHCCCALAAPGKLKAPRNFRLLFPGMRIHEWHLQLQLPTWQDTSPALWAVVSWRAEDWSPEAAEFRHCVKQHGAGHQSPYVAQTLGSVPTTV